MSLTSVKPIKDITGYNKSLASAIVTVIDFSATWCMPCKVLAPLLEGLSKRYDEKKVRFYSIDIDERWNDDIKKEHKIGSVPTVIVFKDGKKFKKNMVGVMPEKEYTERIDYLLKE
jgi:thioredoxin 1